MTDARINNRVIRREISSYKQEMEAILSWMPDWIHQDDFDRKTWDYERNAPLSPYGLTGDSLVLQPFNSLVHLLLLMIADGWVERKGKRNERYYKAVIQ